LFAAVDSSSGWSYLALALLLFNVAAAAAVLWYARKTYLARPSPASRPSPPAPSTPSQPAASTSPSPAPSQADSEEVRALAELQVGDTVASLLKHADQALYAAKSNGRNRSYYYVSRGALIPATDGRVDTSQ